ncbi:aldo/keto reductase [Arcticibacter sp.]
MEYRRCGKSGLKLSAFSLGLWHNFGYVNNFENSRNLLKTAFDNGITHFDLANNYGPPTVLPKRILERSWISTFVHIVMNLLFPARQVMICGKGHTETGDLRSIS